jgi:hypothetical protein
MKRKDKRSPRAVDTTRMLSGHATLPQWRRIALERQLPQPRFPGGLWVPPAIMLVCLVVLGAFAVAYFLRPPPRTVPHAVVESQRDLVSEVAHRLSVGSQRDRDDVLKVVARYAGDPAHDAAKLVAATATGQTSWRSVAIWDPASGKTVAAAGDALPPNVLKTVTDSDTAVGYVGADLRGRLVRVAKLVDGKMLGVSVVMGIRNLRLEPTGSQTVMFVLNGNTLIYSQGNPIAPTDPVRALVTKTAAAKATKTSMGHSVTMNGHLRVPVVSAAPIDGSPFAIVSITFVQRAGVNASTTAAALGAVLVLVAILGYWWNRLAFVRPLRRLLGNAKKVACGELGGASRASRLREAQRIGAALGALSPRYPGPHRRNRRSRIRAVTIVSLMPLVVIIWSVALFVVVRDGSTIPAQVVADYQNHADHAANALRDSFDRGLANLQELASQNAAGAADHARVTRLLSSFVHDNPRFRAAYLLDRNQHIDAHAGQAPLRRGTWPGTTAGLALDQRKTTVPLVLAHVPYGSGQLVAEFDVLALRSVLNRVHGDVHVVDRRMRSVLDTGGFIAFHGVHDNAVRAAATAALSPAGGPPAPKSTRRVVVASIVGDSTGSPAANTGAATAAAPPKSPATALGWVVVVSRDVSDLALPTTQALHVAWLLMVLAITVVVAGWGWQYTIFVRPLKTLAVRAERVIGGDDESAIAPERFDEIGALAICLEVCRQARIEGSERLAGAVRLRGQGQDYTVVMSKIKA